MARSAQSRRTGRAKEKAEGTVNTEAACLPDYRGAARKLRVRRALRAFSVLTSCCIAEAQAPSSPLVSSIQRNCGKSS